MKALGFAGYSGSGKTTLMEKLLPRLRDRGLLVSVIKQSHHDIEVDVPGKDSWRHRRAGAREVLLTSPRRWMLVHELAGAAEPGLHDHLGRLSTCDLVLVEGFRHVALAKIEVWREENSRPWLHPHDPHIMAVAADAAPPGNLPWLDLNDVAAVAAFILEWMQHE
ncbi:MAG TPA: molybdopterin-guanine dinucleotide biosynthesis protein B [Thiobacillaceae bacterium]|nr:molybdopterin-guanine dinucleotide biosynthesis protein B [Thiobacillaceae bacterium]HNU64558.1 molybdopterin-guanine dinucleotide biosynthesis protein B [Thiobacillaceae bacterium]